MDTDWEMRSADWWTILVARVFGLAWRGNGGMMEVKMVTRRKWAVVTAIGLVVVVVVWCGMFREREPAYGGKKLSEWVDVIAPEPSGRAGDATDRREAEDAIRHIGTNGIPYLLRWVRYSPPRWRRKLYDAVHGTLGWPREDWWQYDDDIPRAQGAAKAFAAVGPGGEMAVGELTRLLNDPRPRLSVAIAADALAYLGSAGLPPLMAVLTNQQASALRTHAVFSIGRMGTNAQPAVPILVRCLQSTNQTLAHDAAFNLGILKLGPDLVVPALVKCLQSTNRLLRHTALVSVSRFGSDGRLAVPALLPLLKDPSTTTSSLAREAIRQIDPRALEGNGAR